MRKRVETFGGALALTAAIVSGCGHETEGGSPTRPSAAELHSKLPEGTRCAIELGKYVIAQFQLPRDAANGNFHIPNVSPSHAELTLVSSENVPSAHEGGNALASVATFTYGAYLHEGQIVDGNARADAKVAGELTVQLNPKETAVEALQQADPGTFGVDESNQFAQTPTSNTIDAQPNTAAAYCKIKTQITSK